MFVAVTKQSRPQSPLIMCTLGHKMLYTCFAGLFTKIMLTPFDKNESVKKIPFSNLPPCCACFSLTPIHTLTRVRLSLALSSFLSDSEWRLVAQEHNGTIYLNEIKTEQAKERDKSMDERQKEMCYWGHRFELCVHPCPLPPTPPLVGAVVHGNVCQV